MSDKSDLKILNKNANAHKLVTVDCIKSALEKNKGVNAQYKSHEIIDFCSKGDNYACFVTSCKVTYTLGGEEKSVTFIVKLNNCATAELLVNFSNLAFEKEGNFYFKMLPDLNAILVNLGLAPLRMAECYGVNYDEHKQSLFLQDLRGAGFKMADRMVGLDDSHITLVVQELARLHAASVILEDSMGTETFLQKYDFLDDFFIGTKSENVTQMFQDIFVQYVEMGVNIARRMDGYEKVAKSLEKMAPKAFEILKKNITTHDPKFTVINHGDCWNNNLLFKSDDDGKMSDVRLVDLQICRRGSIALDLNYMFFTSMNGAVRRNGLVTFLRAYYDSFKNVFDKANKEMKFCFVELLREYRQKHEFGLLNALMLMPLVVMSSADTPDFTEAGDDDQEKMMADHQNKILEMLDTNPLLRPRLLDMFDEMVELGVIALD